MSKLRDTLNWIQIKTTLIKITSKLEKNVLRPTVDDFGIEFNEYGITVTLYDNTITLNYSAHYLVDVERVVKLMRCNFNENYVNNPTDYAWSTFDNDNKNMIGIQFNTDKLKDITFVHIDNIRELIIPYLNEFRTNNLYNMMLNENEIRELSEITKRIREMTSENHMHHSTVAMWDNMLTSFFYNIDSILKSFNDDPIDSDILILYHYMDTNTKRYFISDCKNMSDKKLRYVINTLFNEFFDSHPSIVFAYLDDIKAFEWITYNIKHINVIYTRVCKTIPNTIERFPFKIINNHIPSLSTFPTTPFNWLLTNYTVTRVGIDSTQCISIDFNNTTKAIRGNTDALLPYIKCPLRAFELFIKYRSLETDGTDGQDLCDELYDYLDSLSGKNMVDYMKLSVQKEYYTPEEGDKDDIHKFDESIIYNHIRDFLHFIDDGKDIKKSYPNEVTLDDGYVLKMVDVEGSLLKQVRQSIFNHHEESKLSIAQKLAILDNGELMECDVVCPPKLRPYHIQTKKQMIYYGRELRHCLGGQTSSKNLFFRKGTSCAEVGYNKDRFTVYACLDANNTTTDESIKFEKYLNDILTDVIPQYKESVT